MRGGAIGVLDHAYRHSAVTEYLWYAVTELDYLFSAHLTRAHMMSTLYSHPAAQLQDGNEHSHEMYLRALNTLPYMHISTKSESDDTAKMIDEWKKLNAGVVEKGDR